MLLLLLSRFSHVRLCATPQMAAHQVSRPWDSPSKNTGVGSHFLLQCRKVKSEREVAQSCLTLSDPMNYSPPGSSIHGIFPARVLECGAIAFSLSKYEIVLYFLENNFLISFYFVILFKCQISWTNSLILLSSPSSIPLIVLFSVRFSTPFIDFIQ